MTYALMIASGVVGLILGMIVELYIYKGEYDRLTEENKMLRDHKPKIETIEVIMTKDDTEDYFEPF